MTASHRFAFSAIILFMNDPHTGGCQSVIGISIFELINGNVASEKSELKKWNINILKSIVVIYL